MKNLNLETILSERLYQHIGDDQLVYGMPKRMHSQAGGETTKHAGPDGLKTYWRFKPKPHACEKCQAMKGLWFEKEPGPVHPNCKCEIEEFETFRVAGRADAIIVPPGVDLNANIAEARRMAKECEAKAKADVEPYKSDIRAQSVMTMFTFKYKYLWVYDNFKSGARYDFKQGEKHPEYEDFGNYHYGLYTNAMGITETFAQIAAGAWQLKQDTSEWWNPRFIKNWFDDPRDNRRIREGQQLPID